MEFRFMSRRVSRPHDEPSSVFRIERLLARKTGAETDVSHLIDRSYGYQSKRELKWHLAERFGIPVDRVRLASL